MKRRISMTCFSVCLLICASTLWAQDDSRAASVQSSCAHWGKVRVDKHKEFKGESNDVYQTGLCMGYFEGLMDGMNNTGGWQTTDGSIAVFQIKTSSINSTWDVVRAFYAYVDANPLSKGKPAWGVLQHVLITNGLASFVPQKAESRASALNDDCKTGATNLVNEFESDNKLKVIDTPTLVDIDDKLTHCFNTNGLTDADNDLLLTATSGAHLVLLSRAMNVLNRHSLLPEFKAERQPVQNTVSNVPGGITTEQ